MQVESVNSEISVEPQSIPTDDNLTIPHDNKNNHRFCKSPNRMEHNGHLNPIGQINRKGNFADLLLKMNRN